MTFKFISNHPNWLKFGGKWQYKDYSLEIRPVNQNYKYEVRLVKDNLCIHNSVGNNAHKLLKTAKQLV